jgi:hypothetical protein
LRQNSHVVAIKPHARPPFFSSERMEVDAAAAAMEAEPAADGGTAPLTCGDDAAADAPPEGDNNENEFVTVSKSEQLSRDDARLHVEVAGRHVAVVKRGARLYAMDATCYHMGAPLLHGDIEDVPVGWHSLFTTLLLCVKTNPIDASQ